MEHTCGITQDHTVLCWGWNRDGELGKGDNANAYVPTLVSGTLRTP